MQLLEASQNLESAKLKEYEALCSSYDQMTEYIGLLKSKCQAYDSISHLIDCNGIGDIVENAERKPETQCSDLSHYGRVLKHFKWIGIDIKECTNLAGLDDVRDGFENAWKCWSNKNDFNKEVFIEVLNDNLPMIKEQMHTKTFKSFDCIFSQLEKMLCKSEDNINLELEMNTLKRQPSDDIYNFGDIFNKCYNNMIKNIDKDDTLSTDRKALAKSNAIHLTRKTFLKSFPKPISEKANLDADKDEPFHNFIIRIIKLHEP